MDWISQPWAHFSAIPLMFLPGVVVDLLNQLITKCLARAEQAGEQLRLRTIHDLDAAAIRLNAVCKIVPDPQCEDGQLRSIIFERAAREQLERDSTTVDTILNNTGSTRAQEVISKPLRKFKSPRVSNHNDRVAVASD